MVLEQRKERGYKGAGYGCRGGHSHNGASAGLAVCHLNNLRANASSAIGLRPALSPGQKSSLYGGLSSAERKRSRIPSLKNGENMNRQGRLVSLYLTPTLPLLVGEALCPIP
jgi:hypothetical protein